MIIAVYFYNQMKHYKYIAEFVSTKLREFCVASLFANVAMFDAQTSEQNFCARILITEAVALRQGNY